MSKIIDFLEKKYGKHVTEKLVEDGKVYLNNINKKDIKEQEEVMKHIENLTDENGEKILPENFLFKKWEWGMDFSSWLGSIETKKKFMFIGAEPHLSNNYQLVYDFGSYREKSVEKSAICHYNRDKGRDIWNYLTDIFVDDLNDNAEFSVEDEKKIAEFLSQCYITDLCHIVPKCCGQVNKITEKLNIEKGEWNIFRTKVANTFLLDEINAVNPEFIILHGNAARNHFIKKTETTFAEHKFAHSPYKILEGEIKIEDKKNGEFNTYKIISIPHLKGDMRNKLWRCKKYKERPKEAKRILRELTDIKNA